VTAPVAWERLRGALAELLEASVRYDAARDDFDARQRFLKARASAREVLASPAHGGGGEDKPAEAETEQIPLIGIVAFLRSVIRSGENLSAEDERMVDEAIEKARTTPPPLAGLTRERVVEWLQAELRPYLDEDGVLELDYWAFADAIADLAAEGQEAGGGTP
jgi:hypothetical protein